MLVKYKIPNHYSKPLTLINSKKIKYLLFKQTPKFNHKIGGLDILFKNKKSYKQAILELKKEGYESYLTEKNEPYKIMLIKYDKKFLIIIHLHREVSWLGIKTLDSKLIFKNSKKLNKLVNVPSNEDSLLIHTAHILFENRIVRKFERDIFSDILSKKLNWTYINKQLNTFRWKKEFYQLIQHNKINLPYKTILNKRVIYLLLKQAIQFITKRISPRRKGSLIVLNGPNGSGKSTVTKNLVKTYNKLNIMLGLTAERYYFGWRPILQITKLISKGINAKGQGLYKKALNEKIPKFSLKYELFFIYAFFEYLLRYYIHIYPKLVIRKTIFSDRYFYHLYGQYPYAEHSKIMPLLLTLFPTPDKTIVFKTSVNTLLSRRTGVDRRDLEEQQRRYIKLTEKIKNATILESKTLTKNNEFIISIIWNKIFKRLNY